MGEQNGAGPRPTRTVLAEALSEIRERITRLERIESELLEARAAEKALLRLLPKPAAPPELPRATSTPLAPTAARISGEDADRLVIGAIPATGMISGPEILEKTGLSRSQFQYSLARLREADRICSIGERAATRYYLGSGNGNGAVEDDREPAAA